MKSSALFAELWSRDKSPLNTFQFFETTAVNIFICIEQNITMFLLIIYAGII